MCDSCDDMGVLLNGPRRHPLPMGVLEAERQQPQQTQVPLQAFLTDAEKWRIDAAERIRRALKAEYYAEYYAK